MSSGFILFLIVPQIISGTFCDPGMYGEHCDMRCNVYCRQDLLNNTYCLKQSGQCALGCEPGWCGLKCNIPCSRNCLDAECYQQTGMCMRGCQRGYSGDTCDKFIETKQETPKKELPRNDPPDENHLDKLHISPILVVAIVVDIAILTAILTAILALCVFIIYWRRHLIDKYRYSAVSDEEPEKVTDGDKARTLGQCPRGTRQWP